MLCNWGCTCTYFVIGSIPVHAEAVLVVFQISYRHFLSLEATVCQSYFLSLRGCGVLNSIFLSLEAVFVVHVCVCVYVSSRQHLGVWGELVP